MADTRASRSTSPMPATANAVSTAPATAWLTPERVAHAEFRTSFRGLDAAEVRAFLARVASELRSVFDREAELVARLELVEERSTAAVPAPLDIRQVSELLGQETARVLETAREAAADIKARASSSAEATLEAATAEADRLRQHAEGLLAERTAEADEAAAAIKAAAEAEAARLAAAAEERAAAHLAAAEADATRLRTDAESALERAHADGAATREAAREEGKRMVAEARAVRERVLTDMARRRNVARQQLERVRAARERLLEAIDGVRQSVADAHSDLSGSLVEAKLAGDRGARTVDVEEIPPMRELDAEVELAKDTGLIDLSSFESSEDLSPVDTGEFAAVTMPEPAVDRPADPGGDPTVAVPVIVIDEGDDAPAPAGPTAAPTPIPAGSATTPSEPAGVPPVEPVRPAGRAGAIEVVRRTATPAESATPAEPAAAEPKPGDPEDADAPAEAGGRADADESPDATGPAEVDPDTVIDLRDAKPSREQVQKDDAAPSGDRPTDHGRGASSGAGGDKAGRRGSQRRAIKDAEKASELFARLRGRDDGTANGSGTNGSAKVIGVAVAEPATADTDAGADGGSVAEADRSAAADEPVADPEAEDRPDGPVADAVIDADRVVLHTRDAVLAPTIRDLSRQLKLALSDQQNELLEASRNTKGQPDPVVSPLEDMAAIYAKAAADELATAWSLGRRSVLDGDSAPVSAAEVAAEAAALADGVMEALLPRLQAGDGSESWPVDRVRAAYREVRSQRLGELVEYHVYRAYAGGQLAAAPAGTNARWVCDTCGPDCLDNALAGPLAFGAEYPTGHRAPPAFAGCRCVLAVDGR